MRLKNYIKKIIPSKYHLPILYHKLRIGNKLDNEIFLIEKLISDNKRGIDIGANIGLYSYKMSKVFNYVESFEPMSKISSSLNYYSSNKKRLNVYNLGISNTKEIKKFYTPYFQNTKKLNYGLSSVNDPGGDRLYSQIQFYPLDYFQFKDVNFIKIDTEGNELDVLKGAIKTIKKFKPLLLIEIEQRHLKNIKIFDVFEFILNLGYEGVYYKDKEFISLSTFSYEKDQRPFLNNIYNRNYINNFWFKPVKI